MEGFPFVFVVLKAVIALFLLGFEGVAACAKDEQEQVLQEAANVLIWFIETVHGSLISQAVKM
jgi:hypothetical protein